MRVLALSTVYALRAGRPRWAAVRAVRRGVADFRANIVGASAGV
jgi:hypothetical protein